MLALHFPQFWTQSVWVIPEKGNGLNTQQHSTSDPEAHRHPGWKIQYITRQTFKNLYPTCPRGSMSQSLLVSYRQNWKQAKNKEVVLEFLDGSSMAEALTGQRRIRSDVPVESLRASGLIDSLLQIWDLEIARECDELWWLGTVLFWLNSSRAGSQHDQSTAKNRIGAQPNTASQDSSFLCYTFTLHPHKFLTLYPYGTLA